MAWIGTPMLLAGSPRLWPLGLTLLTVVYVAYISPVLLHRETLASRGLGPAADLFLRKDNLAEAAVWFGTATLVGGVLLLLASAVMGLGPWFDFNLQTFFLRLSLYIPSAFFQDGLFFSFFLRRWQVVWGVAGVGRGPERCQRGMATPWAINSWWLAIVSNALLFSLYHLPNRPVMGLALILGLVWGRIFSRTPNLLAAMLGHAVLGTVLHLCLKVSTKIGSAYAAHHKGFYSVLCPFVEPFIAGRFQW
ncbi:MAG: lysostaphin resistance A-like protein [Desulfobacca sp.]